MFNSTKRYPNDGCPSKLSSQDFQSRNSKYKKFNFKIIITENSQNPTEFLIRKIASPLLSSINANPKFGMFHIEILFDGKVYIEWTNSSIVSVRYPKSSGALICIDASPIEFKVELDRKDIISKIASIIVKWNGKCKYHEVKKNCQDFVSEICDVLNIELPIEDKTNGIGYFLEDMKKNGTAQMKFKPSKEFIEMCLPENVVCKKPIEFKTHQNLDNFVKKISNHLMTKHSCVLQNTLKLLIEHFGSGCTMKKN